MSRYRRAQLQGAMYFFTVNLLNNKKWGPKNGDRFYFLRPARRSASPAALSLVPPTGFALHGESLDSLRSPFGPAFGCYSATLRISCLAKRGSLEVTLGKGFAVFHPTSGNVDASTAWAVEMS
jgi:hypothetical protein